ncbi:MAG: peptidase domain-containing ABC transporter [Legionella sp.]|nr:peptidase domain-containing ABC transporter [Legionella sp.]
MNLVMPSIWFKKRAKLPLILQDEMAECGHACIAMISNSLGHDIDLYTIRKIDKPSNRGVTLLAISRLFEKLGFQTRALRVPINEISHIKCPAILHWNMNHFVVLKQVKKNYIVIHDPAVGLRKCSMEEVSKSFTGIVLEVEKASDFEEIKSNKALTLFDLVKSITGVNKFIILLILLSLSIEVLSLLSPLFMQFVTDDVIGASDSNNLYIIASGFILVVLLQCFIEYIRGNMVIYVSTNLTEQFSSNVVKHILKLPLEFFEKRHKGDIQSKFQSIDQIQKKISTDFINTVLDGLMIIINLAVMLVYSQLLSFLVVVALSLFWALRYSSYHFLKKQTESSIYQHARATSVFLETLQGIIPIKAFLKERVRFNTWRNSYINALNADIKVARVNVLYTMANQLLFHIEHIVVVCIGASLVLANKFSIGMLIAFLSYRLLLVNKASSFIHNIFDYKLISIQLNRLSDILFQQPEIMASGYGNGDAMKGNLSLQNICFKYNSNDAYILNNINLEIRAGEKVAIVGPSGCGKSTFLKVVMGLLNKSHGEIFIDGIRLEDFGLKNYRELTASVMQEDSLLSGSIIDNITFFDEEINMERLYRVAVLTCIHDSISKLPMGYETLVGDMGSTLSGGQKQRILLARALYKEPKILFLDEATSHLDMANEKSINEALRTLQITQIIIAHREETIRMSDRVINFEALSNGSI